jgi:hypothetical protein
VLLVAFEVALLNNGGAKPLPAHLGGALHGFIERALSNFAPQLEPVLRPNGPDEMAFFTLLCPPFEHKVEGHLSFGITLFGQAQQVWQPLMHAILAQCGANLNGQLIKLIKVRLERPGGLPITVFDVSQTDDDVLDEADNLNALAVPLWNPVSAGTLHALNFRVPLLVASRGAQRGSVREIEALPWPTLGALLDSLAKRIQTLEPALAQTIELVDGWRAPDYTHAAHCMTWAAAPAKQVQWRYASEPKNRAGRKRVDSKQRALTLPGIVGTLMYVCSLSPTETTLLDIGQWLGVGQKTTMGYGSYSLVNVLASDTSSEALS